jgi:hypothetical protein
LRHRSAVWQVVVEVGFCVVGRGGGQILFNYNIIIVVIVVVIVECDSLIVFTLTSQHNQIVVG